MNLIVPAGAIHQQSQGQADGKEWRWKAWGYLFPVANLAKVFRAKWLEGIRRAGLSINAPIPREWVVHCNSVGRVEKALAYLRRYLSSGVLSEKNILSDRGDVVTFSTQHNIGEEMILIVSGAEFLWMLLRYVLPKWFRRALDDGLLHGNRIGLP